jgi:Fe2+ transport system protein FeoA
VITNNGQGQLAIAADLKRYVLGRGLAEKIMVEQDKPKYKKIKNRTG